jgi:hypothetical protein
MSGSSTTKYLFRTTTIQLWPNVSKFQPDAISTYLLLWQVFDRSNQTPAMLCNSALSTCSNFHA